MNVSRMRRKGAVAGEGARGAVGEERASGGRGAAGTRRETRLKRARASSTEERNTFKRTGVCVTGGRRRDVRSRNG